MKIFIKILVLISISAVYSHHVLKKRYINDLMNNLDKFSETCVQEITKRYECIPGMEDEAMSTKSLDELCAVHASDNCKNLYTTEIKNTKECEQEDNKNMIEFLSIFFSMYYLEMDNYCLKDEKGDYCSIGQFEFEDIYSSVDADAVEKQEKFKIALNNQCKSKKCIEDFIKYGTEVTKTINEGWKNIDIFNTSQNNENVLFDLPISRDNFGEEKLVKEINETITYLKSECPAQASSKNESNDAFLVMYTSSICMAIGLLFYIIFIL